MARTGRFGRRRGSGSNMTALVAALLREYRAARDKAIFDAWQNGGKFEGEPVTDSRLLAYVKERRDQFTSDDPLWDEWNNRSIQLEFRIGEEKIGLRFKQGKISASAVAAWYRGQLSKIPKDSAFYREVAGRAADWAKATSGAARGGGRAAAVRAIDAKIARQDAIIMGFDQVTGFIEEIARREGLISGNQTILDARLADSLDGRLGLTSIIALYKIDLGDGTILSMDLYQQLARQKYDAMGTKIALSEQAGRTTKQQREARNKFRYETLYQINAFDAREAYEEAKQEYEADAATIRDPYALAKRADEFRKELETIRDKTLESVGNEDQLDDVTGEVIGGLNAEIAVLSGAGYEVTAGGSVKDRFGTGTAEGVSKSNTDLEETRDALQQNANAIYDLERGAKVLGQNVPGGPIELVDIPNPVFGPIAGELPQDLAPTIISDDGRPKTVYLKGTPVLGGAVVDQAGVPVDATNLSGFSPDEIRAKIASGEWLLSKNEQAVGFVYDGPGGRTYGVLQTDGSITYTDTNPFVTAVSDSDGTAVLVVGSDFVDPSSGRAVPDTESYLDAFNQGVQSGTINDIPLIPGNATTAEIVKIIRSGLVPGDEVKLTRYADGLVNRTIDKLTNTLSRTGEIPQGGTPGTRRAIRQSVFGDALDDYALRHQNEPTIRVPGIPLSGTISGGQRPRVNLPTIPTINPNTGFTVPVPPPTPPPSSGGKIDTPLPPPVGKGSGLDQDTRDYLDDTYGPPDDEHGGSGDIGRVVTPA